MERSKDLSIDQTFLQSLKEIVLSNLENEQFGAEDISREIGLSRSQVHRKLQKINGKSITQFIRETRLDVAFELLKKEVGTAAEISYRVGFSSPAYFTKCFHEYFGYPPSEILYRSKASELIEDEVTTSDNSSIIPIHRDMKERFESDDRRLAAIMFTDIVGYTALMGTDEDRAFKLLRKNREIQSKFIEQYNGTMIKEMGNGILISFDLASEAVHCALEIQKECKSHNIPLKIGIHEDEMVFTDADVLDDGVNIASRIQNIAEQGCILISGSVYRDIKKKSRIIAEFVQEKIFKNVDEPIKVYKVFCEDNKPEVNIKKQKITKSKSFYFLITGLVVVIASILIWQLLLNNEESLIMPVVSMDKENSIAVLPFDNLSGDPDQEIMCDGLTEEIIHYLSTSKLFHKVTSRSSVMRFKDLEVPLPEIAALLDVNFVIEGSYRQSGNRLRITANLIDASSDTQLWTEIYERQLGDIFDIQSDIAKKIASSLSGELSHGKNEMLSRKPTGNLEAYNLYLKGRFFWHQRTKEDLKMSVSYFNEALELDSTFALALAGLADAYFIMGWHGWYPRNEGYELSKSLVNKALSIDNQIAEAHATLGGLLNFKDRNFSEAEKSLKQAINLNPSYATGHQYYAELLTILNRREEARKEINLALKYNPLSIIMHTISGWQYYVETKFMKAIEEGQLIKKLNKNAGGGLLIYSYLHLGKNEEAVREIIYYDKLDTAEIMSIYIEEGIEGVLRYSINYYLNQEDPNYFHLAYLNMFLKNEEEAIRCIELAYDQINDRIFRIENLHDFQSLHSHPRFIAILDKLKSEEETN